MQKTKFKIKVEKNWKNLTCVIVNALLLTGECKNYKKLLKMPNFPNIKNFCKNDFNNILVPVWESPLIPNQLTKVNRLISYSDIIFIREHYLKWLAAGQRTSYVYLSK